MVILFLNIPWQNHIPHQEYKNQNHLPITDHKREKELVNRNLQKLNMQELETYYLLFFEGVLQASKAYQKDLLK